MFGLKLVKKSKHDAELIRMSRLIDVQREFRIKAENSLDIQKKVSEEYRHQMNTMRAENKIDIRTELLDVDIGDPTPMKVDARREYVGRVAGFHFDIFKPKCLQMISVFHRLIEEETNDRETDLYLKMGIYICREFVKWGDQAVNEQLANQTQKPENAKEKEETIINTVIL